MSGGNVEDFPKSTDNDEVVSLGGVLPRPVTRGAGSGVSGPWSDP